MDDNKSSEQRYFSSTFYLLLLAVGFIIFIRVWKPIFHKIFAIIYFHCLDKFLAKKCNKYKKKLFDMLYEQKRDNSSDDPFTVVEIGAGIGTNFSFFPENCEIIAVDPNASAEEYLNQHAGEFPHVRVVKFIAKKAEDIGDSIADNSVPAVVCTLTMCSCDDSSKFLNEVKRILKPGGKFYFYEHVVDGTWNSWTRTVQRIMWPFMIFFCECDIARYTWQYIENAGFSDLTYERFHGETFPAMIRPQMLGSATK